MRNTVGTWNALSAKKTFKSSILLKRHQNIHTPEENRKCRSCEKVFSSKQALKRHIVVHEDDKAFHCDICNIKLSTKGSLDRHNKNIHK